MPCKENRENIDQGDVLRVLRELWERGEKLSVIAEKLCMHKNDVTAFARVLRLPPRNAASAKVFEKELELMINMRRNGASVEEIAEKIGVHPRTVYRFLRAAGFTPSRTARKCPEIPRDVLEKLLCAEGLTIDQAAARLGIRRSCVGNAAMRQIGSIGRCRMKAKLERAASMLIERGYITSKDLRSLGLMITISSAASMLSKVLGREVRSLVIWRRGSIRYSIFPGSGAISLIYLPGREADAAKYLASMINRNVPKKAVAKFLKNRGIPTEIINSILNYNLEETSPFRAGRRSFLV